MASLFVSTMLYAASKRLGYGKATAELLRQVGSPEVQNALTDEVPGMPCALTIARIAAAESVQLNVQAGGTVIAKARSLDFAGFLASEADCWLSCDDDVAVSSDALRAAISQARAEPCLVILPCLLRDTVAGEVPRVGLVEQAVTLQDRAPSGGKIMSVEAGGFGCFAMSRALAEKMHELAGPENDFELRGPIRIEERGGPMLRRVFSDELIERHWVTEDLAFCRRVKAAGFRIWAVRVGTTTHAGQRLDLDTLEAVIRQPQSFVALGAVQR